MKPQENEYAPFYHKYVQNCKSDDIVTNLKQNHSEALNLLNIITENKGEHAYDEGKWTIKELIQHIIDSERVFAYRAMCIARGETTSLPGFDENIYADNSHANSRTLASIIKEFDITRQATIQLFEGLDAGVLTNMGVANGNNVSVRGIGFIIAGHCAHHLLILQERYL